MTYELMPHQDEFLYSDATHTGLVGGYGCGKSFIGVLKTISKKLQYPGIDVAYYLPTYPLIRDIAFPKFREILENHNIEYKLHQTDKEFQTKFGRIILRSMDSPDLIVGYEVGYSCVDEADVLPKDKMAGAFIKIVARNRKPLPDLSNNATDFVSTPEGFKFLYDFFVTKSSSNKKLIRGRTKDNIYLPSSYIETLQESYTERQLDAYLNGEFVNLNSGTVYYAFDRSINHSAREIQPHDILHIGIDFNITKMSAVVHVTEGLLTYAVEEIVDAYDTSEMISIIKDRYPGKRIIVYPDASGNARNTAGESDIRLLQKAKFKVRVNRSNPSVRDRITAANSGFRNAKGLTSYFVNTHNCPSYTEALERLPYKNGVPDKESGFDHITDAGTYAFYSIQKQNKSIRIHV